MIRIVPRAVDLLLSLRHKSTPVRRPFASLPPSASSEEICDQLIRQSFAVVENVLADAEITALKEYIDRNASTTQSPQHQRRSNKTVIAEEPSGERFVKNNYASVRIVEATGVQKGQHGISVGSFSSDIYERLPPVVREQRMTEVVRNCLGSQSIFCSRLQFIHSYRTPKLLRRIPWRLHYDRVRSLKMYYYLSDCSLVDGSLCLGSTSGIESSKMQREQQRRCVSRWEEIDGAPRAYTGVPIAIEANKGTLVIFDSDQPHMHGPISRSTERSVFILESQTVSESEFSYANRT